MGLDIKPYEEHGYHFKTRKLSGTRITTQHSHNVLRDRGRRFRFEASNRSRDAMEQFDNDSVALLLGMPDYHEDDNIKCQLAERIKTVIDKEIFEASEWKYATAIASPKCR